MPIIEKISRFMMPLNPHISLPIPEPRSDEVPYRLSQKRLPPRPASREIAALQLENEILRQENHSLRARLEVCGKEMTRYHKVACAAQSLTEEFMAALHHLQQSISIMKKAQQAAQRACIVPLGRTDSSEFGGNWI
ncbi:uncharacterized protein PAC_05603 [Phialocephala subalpina]|uniref:BZIP domain-containing protein n=1 Tax=Phialocephala subalpina TaxID=576137 RepID=A0A1L7WSI1_9HELO|nr:uncharacterized protein PAC_05603 [Phialocephala subalpina]